MKKTQTKIEKLSPEQLKAIAPLNAAAAVAAPKAEKAVLNDDKNRKKLTPEQTEEELKALKQAQAEQVADVAGEPIELAQVAEAVGTDAAAGGVVAAETTSGLVGGAAVAGGVGTGAAAGGALLGAAALNNGGGDGSAAAPRELTAFNINTTESFEKQNVIADVVEIEAASVSIVTIAADVSSSESTSLTSEGQVTTIEGAVVAAESVEINASHSGSGDDSIFLGDNRAIDVFELRAVKSEVDTTGVHAKSVELTSETGVISFSQITGGSTLLTTVFNAETNNSYATRTDISVAGSESVTISAEDVSAFGGGGSFGFGFVRTPNLVAKNVDITTDSAESLAVAGGFNVAYEDSQDYDDENMYVGYTRENSAKVTAANEVSIDASNSLVDIQIAAKSIEVMGGASIDESVALFAGSSEFVNFESYSLTNPETQTYTNFYEQTQSVSGAEKVSIEASNLGNVSVVADNSNVVAESIGSIFVGGSVLVSNTSENTTSDISEAYDNTNTTIQKIGAASSVYIEVTGTELTDEMPAQQVASTVDASAAPVAQLFVLESPTTSVGVAAENVEIITVGNLRGSSISEASSYSISGAVSYTNVYTSSYDGVDSGDSYDSSSNVEHSIEAAGVVKLQADGSISSMRVAAELFESTASHYTSLSVDGGEESTGSSSKLKISSEEFDGYTRFASESIDIVATGTQHSSISVKALAGSITTASLGSDWIGIGDFVNVYNAEGQAQNITIDLGAGKMDQVNFADVQVDEANYVVDVATGTVTFTFADGEGVSDVYTLTDVEVFAFSGTNYVLNEMNELMMQQWNAVAV